MVAVIATVDSYTPLRPLGPFLVLAQDADGTPLVLKCLGEDRAADARARHEFRLEAWRAAQLDGPRFTRALDPGTAWQERPFYTMPYAEGPPATLVQPAEVAACVRQLAEALAALHERGWVHAALEPTQLRRTEAGLVLVGYGNLTAHGQRARRPGAGPYQAPEQRAGQPLDGRTDLYALGALIHFWLTGEAGTELDLLDLVADPLADLGRWLLAPKPGDRPPDARTLLAALDRVVPGPRRPEPLAPRAPWLAPPQLAAPSLAPFDTMLQQLDAGEPVGRRLEALPGAGKSTWLDRA
ncbi:MAG: hypothetical protein JWM80_486, partial [Cyanobacteria bacterium RYN_339]|nr:hypothetical protein [Cyanobacteria bacterium RYN_339]